MLTQPNPLDEAQPADLAHMIRQPPGSSRGFGSGPGRRGRSVPEAAAVGGLNVCEGGGCCRERRAGLAVRG